MNANPDYEFNDLVNAVCMQDILEFHVGGGGEEIEKRVEVRGGEILINGVDRDLIRICLGFSFVTMLFYKLSLLILISRLILILIIIVINFRIPYSVGKNSQIC